MEFQRSCGDCQYNFGGFCTAKGFGQLAEGETVPCQLWEISEEALARAVEAAPWYLKKPYEMGKTSLSAFLEDLERDAQGLPVEIGIFDAIEQVYGYSQRELAQILGVSSDVVGYAKAHGAVARRIPHFSRCLHIPEELFRHFTTADLPLLEQCRVAYETQLKKPESSE